MSLVIDLVGQLNCHVIDCEDLSKLIGAFQSIYCSGRSFVSQLVSSVYCLSVLMSLISHLYGAGSCWHRFSSVCSMNISKPAF